MKKTLLVLPFLILMFAAQAQSFYDTNSIQEIRLYFAQTDWEQQLNVQQQTTQNYIPAESVVINGTAFENVGVKYKGNSSYIPFFPKNPFHIELDAFQEQDYQGYTDIKLSNVIFDPTFVRETLSYSILSQYMAAPQCNYANVYVNDVLIGLYVNVESVSKKFVQKHFYSNDHPFFDCSPVNGANNVNSLQELPALIHWGNNVNNYNLAYRMKSDTGWNELIGLTNTLNNNVSNIESQLDIDRTLWMLAFNNIMVNIDSYIGIFNQNYYLYQDENGRFNPVLWDLNMSFGVFADLGSSVLQNTTAKAQLSPFQHLNDNTFPLVNKLLVNTRYRRMYLAHFNTILQENFVNNSYLPKAQALRTLIDGAVQADPNKLNSYGAFQTNLDNDIVTNNSLVAPGITNLVNQRKNFLNALPDFTAPKPIITNVQPSVATPTVGSTIAIAAQVANTNANAVFLGFRNNYKSVFTKVAMFDDGAHNDGAAGDNVYGASVTVTNAYLQYYIYAENNSIGAFSPERAEYEFHSLDATYPTINAGELAVNEIMAQNTTGTTDPAGQFEDWIELYNNTDNTVSLDNLYLTDNANNLQKWQFPAGLTIEPHGYLTVWADEDLAESGLHADFKLSASGESVILSYPNGTIIDQVTFGAQTENVAYARIPNGTGNFVNQPPTFGANNESLSTQDFEAAFALKAWPNPMRETLLLSAEQHINEVRLYNLMGQEVMVEQTQGRNAKIKTGSLAAGVYTVKVFGDNGSATIKVVKQ
ncbi:CotH kinase family protein [Flavobacterium sp.]|uniref:CotH kinase family protein n=1 Tax=Flavobacterium sp. TaxID=239 RepID=UPI0039E5D1AF